MTVRGWDAVWARRRLDPTRGSTLAQLLAADGLDTGFGDCGEAAWIAFAEGVADRLGLTAGSSVLEVGCGAGAFLHPLAARGVEVAGIDRSPALIDIARTALPHGAFEVCDAAALSPQAQADAVVSCGVFLYFDDLDYARRVLAAMARSSRGAVAVLDVPDAATRDAAIAERVETVGGPARYEERYRGLDHLYYERAWMASALREAGLVDVRVEDQDIAGYRNGQYRFNAFGRIVRSR